MLTIRREKEGDARAIHDVNVAAFGGTIEADIVGKLRKRGAITLSLVAVDGSKIVGHILFSPVTVESPRGDWGALGLGPMGGLASLSKERYRLGG